MKTYLALAALLIGLGSTAGCNSDKKDKKLEKSSDQSGFALKAELCGAFVSLADFSEKDEGRRQASLEIAMAVCGKVNDSESMPWSALGARLSTPEVYIHKPDSGFDGGDKHDVVIDGDSKVFAVKGATKVLLGTLTSVKQGAKLKVVEGVTPELAVGNRAYTISDPKSLPKKEMRLFFAVP